MEKVINHELIDYIEKEIFPMYSKNEEGHQINHINAVIKKSLEYAQKYEVNIDMVYTIAAFHDLGYHIDRANHEKISAEIFMKDEYMKDFFSEEQRTIIKEAIEDHRASINYKPRSIYGIIVSTADRNFVDIDKAIKMTYTYGLRNFPNLTEAEQIERIYQHLNEKFGKDGYAKIYIEDNEVDETKQQLIKELSNKDEFVKKIKKVIKN